MTQRTIPFAVLAIWAGVVSPALTSEARTLPRIVAHRGAGDLTMPEASIPEFWIDFKHFSPEFAEKVLAEFAKAGIDQSRIMVATASDSALAYMKTRHAAIRRIRHIFISRQPDGAYRCNGMDRPTREAVIDAVLAACERFGLFGVNMPILEGQTTAEDVRLLHEKGLWVSLWFVRNTKTAVQCRDYGADAFVTDHVSEVRAALAPRTQRTLSSSY